MRDADRVASPEIRLLLDGLDEAFDKRSWHGTNLRGSIRGMRADAAAWRPCPGRHNIWEIVVHAAYWKYTVWRRLTGQKRGSFVLRGSYWFERAGDTGEAGWQSDIGLLVSQHAALREAVARLDAPGDRAHLIRGIAAHDLHHAGQIQLLKRLRAASSA